MTASSISSQVVRNNKYQIESEMWRHAKNIKRQFSRGRFVLRSFICHLPPAHHAYCTKSCKASNPDSLLAKKLGVQHLFQTCKTAVGWPQEWMRSKMSVWCPCGQACFIYSQLLHPHIHACKNTCLFKTFPRKAELALLGKEGKSCLVKQPVLGLATASHLMLRSSYCLMCLP